MRVALMTAGSRGDVAPFTGLGHALQEAGHRVTLVTHGRFAGLATTAGLEFHGLPVDPRSVLESGRGQGLHRSTAGAAKLARMLSMARSLVGRMTDDLLAAARTADVLLLSASLAPLGHAIGTGLGIPSVCLHLQPIAPTSAFAPPLVSAGSWGPHANRLAGRGVNLALDAVFTDAVRDVRARLGLPPSPPRAVREIRERQNRPVLHGFSPLVVPRPRDWPPHLRLAGYWWPYDPPHARLPDRVEEFLASGPPPVFVGLGSATVPDPQRLSRTVVAALRAAGLRGIVQRGWAELCADGEDMLTVDEVPHSLLFPRTAAVVHHAGAGTTAATLRAGVPSVPVPVQFDAAFWASRQVALGVAPAAVPLRRVTPGHLAAALRAATADPAFTDRARDLATRLATEDSTAPVLAALP